MRTQYYKLDNKCNTCKMHLSLEEIRFFENMQMCHTYMNELVLVV